MSQATEAPTIAGDGPSEAGVDRRMLINGELVATAGSYPSINPATEEVFGHAPEATVADAEAAIAAARKAFDDTDWATNVELRVRCMDQFHQALVEHRDELAALTIARGRRHPRADPGRATGPADRDRAVLRGSAQELPDDRGPRKHRGARRSSTIAGWRRKPPEWSRRSSPTTTRTSWRWPSSPRAGRRLHSRAQGCAGHPADHPGPRRADRQPHRHPGRRRQRPELVGPAGRCGADHQPGRRRGHLHRLHPDRSARSWPRPATPSSGCSSSSAASPRRSCSMTPTSAWPQSSPRSAWSPTPARAAR